MQKRYMQKRSTGAFALIASAALALALAAAWPSAHALAEQSKTVPLLVIVVGFDGGEAVDASTEDGTGDMQSESARADAVSGEAAQTGTSAPSSAARAVAYNADYDWGAAIFDEDDSLASYYRDMSGGAFTFVPIAETCAYDGRENLNKADQPNDGVVHVTLHRAHDGWGLVNEDAEIARAFGQVVVEAFQAAAPYAVFEECDGNGDGLLTPDELAVAVCIAGYDASPMENPDRTDIPVTWPHAGVLTDLESDGTAADGMHLTSYIAIAEQLARDEEGLSSVEREPLGILYHELGHYLGLPDLYALNYKEEDYPWYPWNVGQLSLMCNGGWAQVADADAPDGYRYKPTAFDAWSRYVLGWNMPQVVTESGYYQISSQLSTHGYSSLLIPTADPEQYYLLEVRLPEGHDEGLAREYEEGNARGGVVIWHIHKGIYREYALDNGVCNTDHAPAVIELYFESRDGFYTDTWKEGGPEIFQPFYDSIACEANLGNANAAVELPLYSDANDGGSPSDRMGSGITVQFPTEAARDMTVHVELPGTLAGSASRAYPLDEDEWRAEREGESALASIAATAIAAEAAADVGIVDAASILAGLPSDTISFADAYAALPSDENIQGFYLTGAQLLNLAELSSEQLCAFKATANAYDALQSLSFVKRLPALASLMPNADGALTFSGLSFDIDWKAASGARTSNAKVAGEPIEADASYYVAVAPSAVEHNDFFDTCNRDILTLWGTPADALRSYIQRGGWEQNR